MRIEVVTKNPITLPTQAWLLKDTKTNDYYIASGVTVAFSGWEVLVFPADKKGNVTDWLEVAGGRGMTHEEAIEDLENYVNTPEI